MVSLRIITILGNCLATCSCHQVCARKIVRWRPTERNNLPCLTPKWLSLMRLFFWHTIIFCWPYVNKVLVNFFLFIIIINAFWHVILRRLYVHKVSVIFIFFLINAFWYVIFRRPYVNKVSVSNFCIYLSFFFRVNIRISLLRQTSILG